MILQNIIFPDEVCDCLDMYFHVCDGVRKREFEATDPSICENLKKTKTEIYLKTSEWLQTDTYLNAFPVLYWKNYTEVISGILQLDFKGKFRVQILCRVDQIEWICEERTVTQEERGITEINVTKYLETGNLYFRIEALGECVFYGASYRTEQIPVKDVYLAVNICTYHRIKQVIHNLNNFLFSRFYDLDDALYKRMRVYAIDNGNELRNLYFTDGIDIIQNSNQGGGTGGFTRGLQEILQESQIHPFTHVIFMDDDVEVQMESFYRLYAFLSFLKPEYETRGIAGRMFRLDQRQIQYTAVENWNGGEIVHIGHGCDMSVSPNAPVHTLDTGEYGGWWLCAYPVETIRKQKPFPFFIHCDDVEYGLRQKQELLTLPGFQVWHETYEYRRSLNILYYDIRNTLVVNLLYGYYALPEDMIRDWKIKLDSFHNQQKWKEKYICALAMWHLCTEKNFNRNQGNGDGWTFRLCKKERLARLLTPVLHRIAAQHIKIDFEIIKKRYEKLQEDMIWQ